MILRLCVLIGLVAVGGHALEKCKGNFKAREKQGKYLPCFKDDGKCKMPDGSTPKCCENPEGYKPSKDPKNPTPRCYIDSGSLGGKGSLRGLGGTKGPFKNYIDGLKNKKFFEKPKSRDVIQMSTKALDDVGLSDQYGKLGKKLKEAESKLTKVEQRHLGNPFGGFSNLSPGLGLGLGGGFGGILGGVPECPVHVKLCHRVSCGEYGSQYESDPQRCLQNPMCCYDYRLAFMRQYLGPGFMGGAPACYYGPTSKQWRRFTQFFKPWSPWYAGFIIDTFFDLFETESFLTQGKSICDFSFGPKKAFPVGDRSKTDCDLVGGCWDEDLEICTMVSSLAEQLFGSYFGREIYPALFTNDPQDTQCSANWFDFGPKAYQRLECGVGPPPPDIWEMLAWCPLHDCCLNYASLSLEQMSSLRLVQAIAGGTTRHAGGGFGGTPTGFGGLPNIPGAGFGGFPGLPGAGFGGFPGLPGGLPNIPGGFDPSIWQYLFSGSSTNSLSDLYCPYRSGYGSFFPDMSEDTEGCCDIPACYHKKTLVGGGPPPYPPQPPQPPQPSYQWGQWRQCSSTCGPGTHTRGCMYGSQEVDPSHCGHGGSTQPCQGPPCPRNYVYSQWSGCDRSCGGGSQYRTCYLDQKQQFDCPADLTKQSCNQHQCPVQIVYSGWSDCDRSCGGGTQSRRCWKGNQMQSTCPDITSQGCNQQACPVQYRWGQFGPCAASCGEGRRQRNCLAGSPQQPQQVDPQLCGRSEDAYILCSGPPCRVCGWTSTIMQISPCSKSCGGGLANYGRRCECNGQLVGDHECAADSNGPQIQSVACNQQACPQSGKWVWSRISPCGATCGPEGVYLEARTCRSISTNEEIGPEHCPSSSKPQTRPIRCGADNCPAHYIWSGYVTGLCKRTNTGCKRTYTSYCYQQSPQGLKQVKNQQQCDGDAIQRGLPRTKTENCGPC